MRESPSSLYICTHFLVPNYLFLRNILATNLLAMTKNPVTAIDRKTTMAGCQCFENVVLLIILPKMAAEQIKTTIGNRKAAMHLNITDGPL